MMSEFDKLKAYDTIVVRGEHYLVVPVFDHEYYKAKAEKFDKYMELSWFSEEKSPKEIYGKSLIEEIHDTLHRTKKEGEE